MTRAEIQQVKQRFGIIGNTEALSRAIDVAIQVAPCLLYTSDAADDYLTV